MNNDKELREKLKNIIVNRDYTGYGDHLDNESIDQIMEIIATVRNSTIDEVRKFILDKSLNYEANGLKEWATALGLLFGDLYDLKSTSGERENEKYQGETGDVYAVMVDDPTLPTLGERENEKA